MSYEEAKARYGAIGVDTDKAIEILSKYYDLNLKK